jgi:Tfp pilus assembly protein PilO
MANPISTSPRRRSATALVVVMPVLTAFIAIAYAVGGYFVFLVPKLRPLMSGGEYDFTSIRAQLDDDENYAQKMKDTVTAFDKISDEQKLRINNITPFDADIPGLFVQLDEIARANKMLLMSVDASVDEKNVSPLGRKPIRISINVNGGDYEQFKLYLADLERSMRLFDIQTLGFTPDSSSFSLVLRSYFIDRKALLAPPPKPAKK